MWDLNVLPLARSSECCKAFLAILTLKSLLQEKLPILRFPQNIPGQDLLKLGLQDLRRAIAMIPQEPVLFQDINNLKTAEFTNFNFQQKDLTTGNQKKQIWLEFIKFYQSERCPSELQSSSVNESTESTSGVFTIQLWPIWRAQLWKDLDRLGRVTIGSLGPWTWRRFGMSRGSKPEKWRKIVEDGKMLRC